LHDLRIVGWEIGIAFLPAMQGGIRITTGGFVDEDVGDLGI
jgi:hypothetical protein